MSMFKYMFDTEWMQRMDIEELRDQERAMRSEMYFLDKKSAKAKDQLKVLQHEVGELALVCKTLMRIILEKGLCTGKELGELMHEIDLEDGVADGRVTPKGPQNSDICPECDHTIKGGKKRCLYCGYQLPE